MEIVLDVLKIMFWWRDVARRGYRCQVTLQCLFSTKAIPLLSILPSSKIYQFITAYKQMLNRSASDATIVFTCGTGCVCGLIITVKLMEILDLV